MNDFNKIISLFIGLFVVIFVIAFVLGRIKLGSKTTATPKFGGAIGSIFNKVTTTPSPRPTTVATNITTKPITIKRTVESQPVTRMGTNQVTVYNTNGTVKTIPKTGPEWLLPFSLIGLFGGVSLLSKFRNA